MTRHFIKIFALSLLSLLGVRQAEACAFWDDPSSQHFSYFFGQEFFPEGYKNIDRFVEEEDYYGFRWAWMPVKKELDVNLELWGKYFHQQYKPEEIRKVVYQVLVDDILAAYEGYYHGDSQLLNNLTLRKSPVLGYLLYARGCEDYCNFEEYYDKTDWSYKRRTKPKEEYDAIIAEGLSYYNACTDPFLKFRYGYQLIKLYRYSGQKEQCLAFYQQMLQECGQETPVKYWSLSQVAGCQNQLGMRVKAQHNFLKVYLNCPSRRAVVYRSNMIRTQEQWDSLLNLCNRDEKIALYYLRAQQRNANRMEEARSIYHLDPNSDYLPFLMAAHVRRLESMAFSTWKFAATPFFVNRGLNLRDSKQEDLVRTLEFVDEVIAAGQSSHIPMFRYMGAYLELLLGNGQGAQAYLNQIPMGVKQLHEKQHQTLEAMVILQQIKNPTVEDENRMEQYYHLIPDLVQTFMASAYTPSQPMRAYLSHSNYTKMRDDMNPEQTLKVIAWEKEPLKPSWYLNQVLRKRFFNQIPKRDYLNPDSTRSVILQEVLGTQYLNTGNYAEAEKVLAALPEEFRKRDPWFGVFGNPFNYCVRDYDYPEFNRRYTKLDLAKTLAAIQRKVDAGTATPMDWYLLANAYQNTSYFGQLWMLKSYYRTPSTVSGPHDFVPVYLWLEKAAAQSTDREFQAKCYFLAAKARHSQSYASSDYGPFIGSYAYGEKGEGSLYRMLDEMKTNGYLSDYEILRQKYADTEFYQRIINECAMFRYYTENF
ncbi:MAG: hypothetical protein ACEPOZ_06490 [Marinifilaceae bacterium]